ncbi:MAG: malto-oligosyltrehalose synthase [Dehalococcoidales bacterium]|nr:malto-oligosyltrehalose synthase [Dehalococcoidales bacterium]
MDIDEVVRKKLKTINEGGTAEGRLPVSVYRLQFNGAFTFNDAAGLVSYLSELGITDCYASPYFRARRGSLHGYDVSDQNSLNPEAGSRKEYLGFVNRLRQHNMGQVLDFVPNHMSIFDNPAWQDVLENGLASIYSSFFDIDWHPVKAELHGKVLLPLLEDLYGVVLERGQIALVFEKGAFFILYRDHRLPVEPGTTPAVLEDCLTGLQQSMEEGARTFQELQSIITACKNLPDRSETGPAGMEERHREKEIIKRRLGDLAERSMEVRFAIENAVKSINGTAGDSRSFIKLHQLLERQVYRLSYWRVAGEEINYRRFFDINELVALRMEDPHVFRETHRLVSELFGMGMITGIRIDHVDGLYDPADYLCRLQRECRLGTVLKEISDDPRLSDADLAGVKNSLVRNSDPAFSGRCSPTFRPVYIVVEKILGENEVLNRDWPVEGTTGYDFMYALNQVFINGRNGRRILEVYREFTGLNTDFEDVAYQCKNLVMKTSLVGEINLLAHQLNIISEKSWQYRDFTLNSLADAIRELIACFPVYRTYIDARAGSISEDDRTYINSAVSEAKRRNPAVNAAVFDFIRDTLLLQYPAGADESWRDLQGLFVMRFQQCTSPVMAKGVEDTAFYNYNPLISLNDVGFNPRVFGCSTTRFHRQNMLRSRYCPHSFNATSTHDSKRGEDVRARINVLSEIPAEWKADVLRWSRLNSAIKPVVNGELVPDRNEEYLLYQTLLGTCPADSPAEEEHGVYLSRIQDYMLKALREAKVHSSWTNPNITYEEATAGFIEAILEPLPQNRFLADFRLTNRIVSECGIYNSLSQVVLKVFSPGIPDVYQGNELWTFSLTDPDNRVSVDFQKRIRLLEGIKEKSGSPEGKKDLVRELMDRRIDGRIKLYVTWKSLNFRKENRPLFEGTYRPLKAAGSRKEYICAFSRRNKDKAVIVVVPRFPASLTRRASVLPLGKAAWRDTRLVFPQGFRHKLYRHVFTGETVEPSGRSSPGLSLAEVFRSFPVAVLEPQ